MDVLTVLYISGGVASIVGLLLLFRKRPERRKGLTYGVDRPIQLARVLPQGKGNRLFIMYEREGEKPENVKGAFLHYVGVANLGTESIRREDLVAKDPLRLEVKGGRVLDVSVDRVKRDVIDFAVAPTEDSHEGISSYYITFNFLDFQDGGLIRVLTDTGAATCQVVGTIIGMPQGIAAPRISPPESKLRTRAGVGLSVLAYLVAIAAGEWLTISVTHRLDLWWLTLIPFASLAIPSAVIFAVSQTVWPHAKGWPPGLMLPGWLHFSGLSPSLDVRFMLENANDYVVGKPEDDEGSDSMGR